MQFSNRLFSYFGRIRILNATLFQVPNALENVYLGSGGCAQTAGIKIQLEYDLYSGEFQLDQEKIMTKLLVQSV